MQSAGEFCVAAFYNVMCVCVCVCVCVGYSEDLQTTSSESC